MSKKNILIIIACVGLLLIGGLSWLLISNKLSPAKETNKKTASRNVVLSYVCKEDIIKKASPAIRDGDITVLREVAENIMTLPNYQGDVNCDYILARYYLITGRVDQATDIVDTLEATMTAGGTYSTAFDPAALRAKDLRPSIEVLRKLNQSKGQQTDADELNAMDKIKI